MTKKNYKYGKLVDGKLVYAPNKLLTTIVDDTGNIINVQAFNAISEMYLDQGWYPVERAPYPEDEKYYEETIELKNDTIVVSWVEKDLQDSYPISDSERIDILEQAFLEYVLEQEANQNG